MEPDFFAQLYTQIIQAHAPDTGVAQHGAQPDAGLAHQTDLKGNSNEIRL
jgi:hypothetical protein